MVCCLVVEGQQGANSSPKQWDEQASAAPKRNHGVQELPDLPLAPIFLFFSVFVASQNPLKNRLPQKTPKIMKNPTPNRQSIDIWVILVR